MGLMLKYTQQFRNGWRYRRRVPLSLQPIIEKNEITRALGATQEEAAANWHRVHREVEALFLKAKQAKAASDLVPAGEDHPKTPLEAYEELRKMLLDFGFSEKPKDDDEDKLWLRDVAADLELEKVGEDLSTGEPLPSSDFQQQKINALRNGLGKRPVPTLLDAKKLYIEERIGDTDVRRDDNIRRLETSLSYLQAIRGENPKIRQVTRMDARDVVKKMLSTGDRSPSTVNRMLRPVTAMFNLAIREFEVEGYTNPFLKLNIKDAEKAKDKRVSLPDHVVEAMTDKLSGLPKKDLILIWQIAVHTGCRIGEVAGAKKEDVCLKHEIPYLFIRPNEMRGVKNQSSIRRVPLRGAALEAARKALSFGGKSNGLFLRYYKSRGNDGASQILMKHLRTITSNPKHVIHSLRHRMTDQLRMAYVPKDTEDAILGHASKDISSQVYGGEKAALKLAAEAIDKAIKIKLDD